MILKTETEHLTCNMAKDGKGCNYWQIWEKGKDDEPIAIFVNEYDIRINESIENVVDYVYFEELKKIINDLADSQ